MANWFILTQIESNVGFDLDLNSGERIWMLISVRSFGVKVILFYLWLPCSRLTILYSEWVILMTLLVFYLREGISKSGLQYQVKHILNANCSCFRTLLLLVHLMWCVNSCLIMICTSCLLACAPYCFLMLECKGRIEGWP